VYRKHFLEEKSRHFNSWAIAASKLLGAEIGGHTGKSHLNFSGGMKRRLNLAAALLHDPQIDPLP
jgi:ABC-type multidrug transport system ATPase subunit